MAAQDIRQGIYNVDYFSGSQCAVYIGDTWVDEVTSLTYVVQQDRVPLYGYADQLFSGVSKGQVIIQGEFTINFKEAGYLFLILDRYQTVINQKQSVLGVFHKPKVAETGNPLRTPFESSDRVHREAIESITNNDGTFTTFEKNIIFQALAGGVDANEIGGEAALEVGREDAAATLTGFSSTTRQQGGVGRAENIFEAFEDAIWARPEKLDDLHRRADDPRLNPFDIYMTFGDFAGDNAANHTIQRLSDVHIVGSTKQIVIDGNPVQEAYTFLARNLV